MKYLVNGLCFVQGLLIGLKIGGDITSWWIVLSPTIITVLLLGFLIAMIANWDDEQT